METPQTKPLVFRFEEDLEDHLARLPTLVPLFGQDLLIIGRQIGGQIDLLAIDSTGLIYVIELKLNQALPSITTQVLRYRRWIKRLNREKLIGVAADGDLKVDLVEDFQRHFGHPLPETVNESQVLIIIAASFHRETAEAISELQDLGCSCTTFRYVLQPEAVSLIPCCRDDQDVEEGSHAEPRQTAPRSRVEVATPYGSPTYRVDENVRRFWLTHAAHFTTPLVTFRFVYDRYMHWAQARAAAGQHPPLHQQDGQFGRQLRALIAESSEWTPVFVPPGSYIGDEPLTDLPSIRTYRAADHTVSAYLRKPIGRETEYE